MPHETTRSRIRKVLTGAMPDDRLPRIEWATWWTLTIDRWRTEDLPADLDWGGIKSYFGLDMDYQCWIPQIMPNSPIQETVSGHGLISNEDDYERLLPYLYPRPLLIDYDLWRARAREQANGDAVIWLTLNGFFWWPRVLFGIEPHLYAFYDYPELMQRICREQTAHLLYALDEFCREICVPDFVTIAEDMSYNHGPMLSKSQFDEFLAPWYRQIIPRLKAHGITVIVDSDGDVEPLIPWLEEVGVEGILPLERMAGVDVNRIRANHPHFKMIGGFDKTIMHCGEAALRTEFERLLPAMRSGCYIPAVDHQTPPAVSMADYRLFLQLLDEYSRKAVTG